MDQQDCPFHMPQQFMDDGDLGVCQLEALGLGQGGSCPVSPLLSLICSTSLSQATQGYRWQETGSALPLSCPECQLTCALHLQSPNEEQG